MKHSWCHSPACRARRAFRRSGGGGGADRFSFTPNSAAAERVFSLLKLYFSDDRNSSLADMIQTTLMLIYNKRVIGHAE